MPAMNKKVTASHRANRISARLSRIEFCIERAEKGPSNPKSKALLAALNEEHEARSSELKFMAFKAKGERSAANG